MTLFVWKDQTLGQKQHLKLQALWALWRGRLISKMLLILSSAAGVCFTTCGAGAFTQTGKVSLKCCGDGTALMVVWPSANSASIKKCFVLPLLCLCWHQSLAWGPWSHLYPLLGKAYRCSRLQICIIQWPLYTDAQKNSLHSPKVFSLSLSVCIRHSLDPDQFITRCECQQGGFLALLFPAQAGSLFPPWTSGNATEDRLLLLLLLEVSFQTIL